MKITAISISNFKSIRHLEEFPVASYQAFVGENNTGKSNILTTLDVFLSAGAGGIGEDSFYERLSQ
jgi:AAA15 family ATPase/GTPase